MLPPDLSRTLEKMKEVRQNEKMDPTELLLMADLYTDDAEDDLAAFVRYKRHNVRIPRPEGGRFLWAKGHSDTRRHFVRPKLFDMLKGESRKRSWHVTQENRAMCETAALYDTQDDAERDLGRVVRQLGLA